jgi:hypothetical protein
MTSRPFSVHENDAGEIIIDTEANLLAVEEGWTFTVVSDAMLDDMLRVQSEWKSQQDFLYIIRDARDGSRS